MRKIILFELNEVPPRIFEEYRRWRPASAFARYMDRCRRFETRAEDEGILSPWITWPTLHRGVSNSRHGIGNFGQDLADVDREYPPVWKLLADQGVETAVCGSLHSWPLPPDPEKYSFFLPDTFAAGSECFPARLSRFQEFNLAMAGQSARNVSGKIDWLSALRFLAAAPGLGLKSRTALDVGLQLLSERQARWKKTRRRTYQSVLAFDIFTRFLDRKRPAFATFFTNHVASSLHRYWVASFPQDYTAVGYDDDWIERYSNEIDFTMTKADRMFARLVHFADRNPDYQIWMMSSMGQEATEAEPLETQLYFRDAGVFMTALGFGREDWEARPAMLPRYNFSFASREKAVHMCELLSAVKIAGEPVEHARMGDTQVMVKLGQRNLHGAGECVTLRGSPVAMRDLGLEATEIEDMSSTTAYHIPQGTAWIYDPQKTGGQPGIPTVSTVEILPSILKNFGVSRPGYMENPVPIGV